ncbi:DUF262 domain-containing protein [Helicobacter ailurogastricus]|uniref:DUF262 domain-containing protein n=1 Tax=Helicobacter ailurogastricus TaxID=1578720 RepID=UPI0006B51425|nr:DUF262 domain-containing protein [Helicobacter ailurogastricus]
MEYNNSELVQDDGLDNLKSIQDLRGFKFLVPSYQRGYRWTEQEVKDLLNDIWNFDFGKNNGAKFYCLQPIVVKQDSEGKYRVIDGQQRLTTIFLIIEYLKSAEEGLEKESIYKNSHFEIAYEARMGSAEFLKKIKDNFQSDETKENIKTNIDFYHFVKAYESIKRFFEDKKKEERENFLLNFLDPHQEKYKILWYEALDEENEVFRRLNSGKIPLEEVEKIKALFLSKGASSKEDKDEQTCELKERAEFWYETEIKTREKKNNAIYGDFIYCWLSAVNPKRDIMFVEECLKDDIGKKKSKKNTFPMLRDSIQRIRVYFEAVVPNKEIKEKGLFRCIYDQYLATEKAEKIQEMWDEVKRAIIFFHDHAYISKDDDRTRRKIFHYLGFLVYNGISIYNLYQDWKKKANNSKNEAEKKEKFVELLLKRVKKEVPKNIEDLCYPKDRKILKSLLLLFELDYWINGSDDDYSEEKRGYEEGYFEFNRFALGEWTLEHIHAQNSKGISTTMKSENKKSEQDEREVTIEWLKGVEECEVSEELKQEIKEMLEILQESKTKNKQLDSLQKKELKSLLKKIDDDFDNRDDLHKISNLTLLSKSANSAMGNLIFSKKKEKIDKFGWFFFTTTKMIFARDFLEFHEKKEKKELLSYNIFTLEDRNKYLAAIKRRLASYVKNSNEKI